MKMSTVLRVEKRKEFNFNDKFIPLFKHFENCTLDEIWDKINCIENEEDVANLWDEFTDYCYENNIVSVRNNIGNEFFEE